MFGKNLVTSYHADKVKFMDRWMDGWMDRQTDGQMQAKTNPFGLKSLGAKAKLDQSGMSTFLMHPLQGKNPSHVRHSFILTFICAKYKKNPSGTANVVLYVHLVVRVATIVLLLNKDSSSQMYILSSNHKVT